MEPNTRKKWADDEQLPASPSSPTGGSAALSSSSSSSSAAAAASASAASAEAAKKRVLDLLLWKRPVLSGLVLGSILGLFYLSNSLGGVLVALSYVAFWGLLAFGVASLAARFLPPSVTEVPIQFGQVLAAWQADSAGIGALARAETDCFNAWYKKVVRIVQWQNLADSVKALGAILVFYFVSSLFSFTTWLLIVVIAAFSVPKLYLQNKNTVDAAVKQAWAVVSKQARHWWGLARAKLGELSNRAGGAGGGLPRVDKKRE